MGVPSVPSCLARREKNLKKGHWASRRCGVRILNDITSRGDQGMCQRPITAPRLIQNVQLHEMGRKVEPVKPVQTPPCSQKCGIEVRPIWCNSDGSQLQDLLRFSEAQWLNSRKSVCRSVVTSIRAKRLWTCQVAPKLLGIALAEPGFPVAK